MSRTGTYHAHGCRRCRVRYADACDERRDDDLCTSCRGGIPQLLNSYTPRDCCYATSRLVTKDERTSYALAGRSNWHICATCKRTHPAKPQRGNPRT